jgi:hypothetical protein
MPTWNPQIPFNFRTGVFSFLMGSVFSVPVGLLPTRHLLFEPPESLTHLYPFVVTASFLLLPFWCVFAVRQYSPLPAFGTITFILGILAGLLFPAIS